MIFDSIIDRRGTNCEKWNRDSIERIAANRDAEPFWVADMDFPADEHIRAKALEVAASGTFGYPSFDSIESSFLSWIGRKHSWDPGIESILFTNGLLNGIALTIDTITEPGDSILIPTPAYKPFYMMARWNDRNIVYHRLGYENGRFFLDRERFRKDAEKSSLILFCSPHNPSGMVFTESDLAFVLTTAKELGIPVLSDEIHADLVHPGFNHIPMGKANEAIGAEAITFMAPSKTFNIAGEHSGFAVFSSPETKRKVGKRQHALWISEPGYMVGELLQSAYSEGLEYNRELCAYLGGTADMMREYLERDCPEIRLVNAEASFVAFLDCSSILERVKAREDADPERYRGGRSGGVLSRFFGAEASVAMNDGSWFGEGYEGFVRFNYGTSRDRVMKALERMARAVRSL